MSIITTFAHATIAHCICQSSISVPNCGRRQRRWLRGRAAVRVTRNNKHTHAHKNKRAEGHTNAAPHDTRAQHAYNNRHVYAYTQAHIITRRQTYSLCLWLAISFLVLATTTTRWHKEGCSKKIGFRERWSRGRKKKFGMRRNKKNANNHTLTHTNTRNAEECVRLTPNPKDLSAPRHTDETTYPRAHNTHEKRPICVPLLLHTKHAAYRNALSYGVVSVV